jgi:hypothetical protein
MRYFRLAGVAFSVLAFHNEEFIMKALRSSYFLLSRGSRSPLVLRA